LIAGARRLQACRELGWTDIPATVLAVDRVRAELACLDENLVRKSLTILERAEMLSRKKALHLALHPETRRGVAGGRASGASRRGEERTSAPVSFVREASRLTALSPRAIQGGVKMVAEIPEDVRRALHGTPVADHHRGLKRLARLPHHEQRAIAAKLAKGDATTVRRALLLHAADQVARMSPGLPKGKFSVIVVDPPWEADMTRSEYPSMNLDQIKALPVARVLAEHALVWVWTTNAMLRDAFEVLDAWGLTAKTILTWHKNRPAFGEFLLNTTEHCILAVKGRPVVVRPARATTILRAPQRDHSQKPDEFYTLVETLCPSARRLDMFARQTRPGWSSWGCEVDRYDTDKVAS
jgi:N6-adenosine-specific RNA methylase IME4